MTAKTWQKKLREACEQAGTWQPHFGLLVDQLAETLAQRDEARAQFRDAEDDLGDLLVEQSAGKGYRWEKNPILQLISDLDRDALAMLRELGLTPMAQRRLRGPAGLETPKAPAEDNVLAFVRAKHRA